MGNDVIANNLKTAVLWLRGIATTPLICILYTIWSMFSYTSRNILRCILFLGGIRVRIIVTVVPIGIVLSPTHSPKSRSFYLYAYTLWAWILEIWFLQNYHNTQSNLTMLVGFSNTWPIPTRDAIAKSFFVSTHPSYDPYWTTGPGLRSRSPFSPLPNWPCPEYCHTHLRWRVPH